MRVAFAHWKDRLSPVFDVSDRILLIDFENGREKRRGDIPLSSCSPLHRAKEVSGLGAEVLICGAISQIMKTALTDAGVQVTGFICGNLEAVISAFMRGELNDARFNMPGSRGKCRRRPQRPLRSDGPSASSKPGDRKEKRSPGTEPAL
ncbi:MAG: hypothetical protein C4530_21845 [Desulfobacteraceae bacterium]|nr:MAG: hypothetical protein C4530_21845 [Desulfobacteraceae bacterium]